jgi:hypothetical protein
MVSHLFAWSILSRRDAAMMNSISIEIYDSNDFQLKHALPSEHTSLHDWS